MPAPELSIVIPVHNEELILEHAIRGLSEKLAAMGYDYELLLAENGSNDQTYAVAQRLQKLYPRLHILRSEGANYGRALRQGILEARGDIVICDEIDLGDTDFYRQARDLLLAGKNFVVGSKRHPQSLDQRPWVRRQGTAVINTLLRWSLGFHGTDTHGLKAFLREPLLPIVKQCVVEHDLFASELVIRAERAGIGVHEIPLRLREIRPPSVHLAKRVPRVLKNLARLVYVIRIRG